MRFIAVLGFNVQLLDGVIIGIVPPLVLPVVRLLCLGLDAETLPVLTSLNLETVCHARLLLA